MSDWLILAPHPHDPALRVVSFHGGTMAVRYGGTPVGGAAVWPGAWAEPETGPTGGRTTTMTPQPESDVACLRRERNRLHDALRQILEYTYLLTDQGPPGQGWKSEELQELLKEAEAAVAEVDRWGDNEEKADA